MLNDLRHAARLLAKNPGVTIVAVISIAFGTGANVAIFSAADALLLRPLPVLHPYEIVTVGSAEKIGPSVRIAVSYPDYVDIRDRSRSFDGLVAYTGRTAALALHGDEAPQVKITAFVSANFFRVLGIEPAIGRSFLPSEDLVPGRDAVAVLSAGLWKQEFGSDPAIVGRKLRIAGIEFAVIGVAPERFTGLDSRPIRESVFVPLAMWPRMIDTAGIDPMTRRDFRALTLKGRLKPGVPLRQAQAELATIGADLVRAYPQTNRDHGLTAETEVEVRYRRSPLSGSIPMLSILSLAVLGVACANVAALLLSRAPARAQEIAIRLAVGAGRVRLIRQLMIESFAIALAGGVGGLGVGYAGIILLHQYTYPSTVVAAPEMKLDERALLLSMALAVMSAFAFGLAPAIQMTRVDLVNVLKVGDTTTRRRERLAGRNALVAGQVAISLVLVTIVVFALQMFRRQLVVGPGFRTTRVAKLTLDPTQAQYNRTEGLRFFERATDGARRVAGVQSVGLTSGMPFVGGFNDDIVVAEGYRSAAGQPAPHAWSTSVDEGYFDAMRIPLLAGRGFTRSDTAETPRVAVVNETLARRCWPNEPAVGQRLRMGDLASSAASSAEVVGVVKTTEVLYPGELAQDLVYVPFRQEPRGSAVLLAHTNGDSASVLTPLREMLRGIDANVPVYDVQTVETFYAGFFGAVAWIVLGMIGAIGIIGLTLMTVGLYGLVAYIVSRRTREIGIRMAIGASDSRVVGMIMREAMKPVWVGLAAGLALSAATARLLLALIPMSQQVDRRFVVLAAPIVLASTVLAAFVPARRAARADPTVALRRE